MKKTVLIVIRVICIVGFLVCAGVLGWYWHSDRSDRAVAEALAAAHDAASAAAIEQVRAVAADNADTIGWLRIDGTNINNVVMFAPGTPGKYLHMDFYGKWSYRGTLYVAENCDVRTADNILIYGHHMKDGSMFSNLKQYQDSVFRKNSGSAYLYLTEKTLHLEITECEKVSMRDDIYALEDDVSCDWPEEIILSTCSSSSDTRLILRCKVTKIQHLTNIK